ncbi:TrmB family transcriptional regulator [Desulfovirgula thermocuniculi]|uniref:TrmB family transcriptional regulator n=1 Tax=Desulfovirgula thermocuniculi TaxID=348842 RepID=UPI00146F9CAC|nr:TrmB family transcriptional regulator [Desulfovirgula thermocuniculi]
MPERQLELLTALGLSLYEAKAYLALLRQNPANAHEVSRVSGIPASRVYETLNRLVRKGLVVQVGNDPVRYVPLPARDLIMSQRAYWKRILDELECELSHLEAESTAEVIWHLYGYAALIEKAREVIKSAQKSLLVSIWTPQAEDVAPQLKEAAAEGVSVVIIQFGPDPQNVSWPIGKVYRHVMIPSVYARHGSEMLIVSDKSFGFLMSQVSGREWEGFWTTNRAVIRVITNYIRHDIYLAKIADRFMNLLTRTYGENLELLLNIEKDEVTPSVDSS